MPMWYLCYMSLKEKHLCHYVRWDLISTLFWVCCAAQYMFIFLVWGACFNSRNRLLSKHLTQLTPKYKVTKIKWSATTGPLPCHLVSTVRALNWGYPHGCQRLQNFLPTITPKTGLHLSLRGRFGTAKEDPRSFSAWQQTEIVYFPFLFKENHRQKHCLNSHFKNNCTTDSRHLSCCHWNLGRLFLWYFRSQTRMYY